ncbi:MAG: amidohydrolase family protein [Lachnospiraceae bacterium]|nr:amidohydrolase family protein [Lachnospiraceae bacterium]
MKRFVLKGTIIYCKSKEELAAVDGGYAVCEDGICRGVFETLPERYQSFTLKDYGSCLIIPGMTDLHVHAPQYTVCGYAMDLELMDWLNAYIFPEEAKYHDLSYAKTSYQVFVQDLVHSPTTRLCAFGTLHTEGTLELMRQLEEAGFTGYVGKVSMDRNSPNTLRETDGAEALKGWLSQCNFKHIRPILTPRFIPACSDRLMAEIGELQAQTHLPLQSHLSENPIEIAFVKELCPDADFYGDAYDRFGTFGTNGSTIMAHCVYSDEAEIARMKENNVYVAHCAESNFNLSSGIAPVRRFLDAGLHMGLGTDIGAGTSVSMFRSVKEAIIASKMYWRLIDSRQKPLQFSEAFYLATRGGGSFFGKAGSFEDGFDFDAVVIDDRKIRTPLPKDPVNRLERVIYADDCRTVIDKYIQGRQVICG